jgi:hypothetical protein
LRRYYSKTFNQVLDKKKVAKWRETLLKLVVDLEMFCRLTNEMLIDDLTSCLAWCGADGPTTVALLKANFESYFGLKVKSLKLKKVAGGPPAAAGGNPNRYKYELLEENEVEAAEYVRRSDNTLAGPFGTEASRQLSAHPPFRAGTRTLDCSEPGSCSRWPSSRT